MKKKLIATYVIFTIALMTGCQTPAPNKDQLTSANYGPPVSQAVMVSSVKTYMSQRLIDPLSAIYQCNTPRKSWIVAGGGLEGNVQHGKTYYGYYSVCSINSKNRLGGYVGAKQYHFMVVQVNGSPALAHFDGFESGGPVRE